MNSESPQFLADEVLVPWNTSDGYPQIPREYYEVRFEPELDTGRAELVAKDTINSSPKRHLLNGRPYLLSRRDAQGMVVASLADGGIPAPVNPGTREAVGMRTEKTRFGMDRLPGAGTLRRFDARGRELSGSKHLIRSYSAE